MQIKKDMTVLPIWVDRKLKMEFQIKCVRENTKMAKVLKVAINDFLKK